VGTAFHDKRLVGVEVGNRHSPGIGYALYKQIITKSIYGIFDGIKIIKLNNKLFLL